MISGLSSGYFQPPARPANKYPALFPTAQAAQQVLSDLDLGDPKDPRSAWAMMFGAPLGATAGAAIGGLVQGRAGAAVGSLAGGLLGVAIGAVPRLWDVLTHKDPEGEIRQQLTLLGAVASSTLAGAKIGRTLGGDKGALVGTLIGSGAAIAIPVVIGAVWLMLMGLVWGRTEVKKVFQR